MSIQIEKKKNLESCKMTEYFIAWKKLSFRYYVASGIISNNHKDCDVP